MRKIAAVLSALALAVSLGACGDKAADNGGGNSGGDATEGAMSLAALAKSVGDQTAEVNTAHMVFSGGAGGMEIKGEGDIEVGGTDPALQMDMETGDGTMSMVLLDGVLYMKVPQELQSGKPWIKIDSTDKSNPLAQALGSISDQMRKNADPRQALDQFKDSGEITSTKEEDLDGKQTTHYSITVDVQKLADSQTDPTLQKAMREAIKSGLKDFPVDLWVDSADLPARMTVEMPTADPTSGKAVPVKVQVDYSDWGKAVDIQAPPADQVGQLPG
ncbi:MAG: hypothetical protein GEV28_01295 [Actinophytocola sp.]|uniref:hypothetical protein n=1 Tax=Actinophytocola sp. TaxID=1872138 RepID=UPI001320F87E|nr:hypothetical protein [Actinophytocola sp.]MPZ79096.1 hypothetical protein [Actinophytocola sp.]